MYKLYFVISMIIFGTIGIFVKNIPLPSSMIAQIRAVIGVLFLVATMLVRRKSISFSAIKQNALLLCVSGAALGVNWILLFESYNYSVAIGTLCYYLAPTFVIIASPFLLKERLSATKATCALIALVGMVFVSGVLNEGFGADSINGVYLGLGAAVLYASIILMNKKMKNIPSFDMTIIQLLIAAVVLLPYVLLTEDVSVIAKLSLEAVISLIILGIVHTGIAYALYFASIKKIKAQTVAIFSYIDPAFAVLLAILVLGENMTVFSAVGAILILGASALGELQK